MREPSWMARPRLRILDPNDTQRWAEFNFHLLMDPDVSAKDIKWIRFAQFLIARNKAKIRINLIPIRERSADSEPKSCS